MRMIANVIFFTYFTSFYLYKHPLKVATLIILISQTRKVMYVYIHSVNIC